MSAVRLRRWPCYGATMADISSGCYEPPINTKEWQELVEAVRDRKPNFAQASLQLAALVEYVLTPELVDRFSASRR
jgi:hypothetical protein